MHIYFSWLFLFLFSSAVNGQPTGYANVDDSAFPDIPFIPTKAVQEFTRATPKPRYPQEARAKKICGEVVMAVKVGVDGSVIDTKIARAEPPNIFEKSVVEVIWKWRYKRVTFNDEPVVYQTKRSLNFPTKSRLGMVALPLAQWRKAHHDKTHCTPGIGRPFSKGLTGSNGHDLVSHDATTGHEISVAGPRPKATLMLSV